MTKLLDKAFRYAINESSYFSGYWLDVQITLRADRAQEAWIELLGNLNQLNERAAIGDAVKIFAEQIQGRNIPSEGA